MPVLKMNQMNIVNIVDNILVKKQAGPTTDTSALEAEIDSMVYELYGLTKDEIKIIEQNVK